MHIYPSEPEVNLAVNRLMDFKVSSQLLSEILGVSKRNKANSLRQRLGQPQLTKTEIARLLVYHRGSDLFAGSGDEVRRLREHMLRRIDPGLVHELWEQHQRKDSNITSAARMIGKLAEKPWHADGRWSAGFVKATGFPEIFSGVRERVHRPTVQEVPPRFTPPPLQPYQVKLKKQLLKVMEHEGNRTRCVLSLPTGGGKTRVAVEAFIDWMHPRFSQGQYLLWVAQSEELCEQAIACLDEMWRSRPYRFPLRVYRYFGGRDVPLEDLSGGAVVASINQLHNRDKSRDPALDAILQQTGVLIIDEAHRAVTKMYDGLLDRAAALCGPDLFPICGLTATPGRAGLNKGEEINRLVGRFEAYLLTPDLGPEFQSDPLRFFREKGYLATPQQETLDGRTYDLTAKEMEQLGLEQDFPDLFRRRLADDANRNLKILTRLQQIPAGIPTLVYACTVEHAHLLAMILRGKGRTAAVISSDTSLTLRRGFIEKFKSGEIQFLCNYGVLTTGFDAPKTEAIVLCRPTRSEVLYEQIIGRGLRGPLFGGTPTCRIIDFADNIRYHGAPLTYIRFKDFWDEGAAVQPAAG